MNEGDEEQVDADEADRQITAFIVEADRLPGPAVGRLADDIETSVEHTADLITALLSGVPHNKVLATMLLLSQRARTTDSSDDRHWRLHAASTLLSALIIPPGSESGS